jgi:cobalt/nickel transport system permease protein
MSRPESLIRVNEEERAGVRDWTARGGAILRIAVLFLGVGLIVGIPLGRWGMLGVAALALCAVILCGGISWRELLNRWLRVALVLLIVVLAIAPGHPARGMLGLGPVMISLAVKSFLSVGVVLTFVQMRGWHGLLSDLRFAGVPAVLVATLYFLDRYRWVLGYEREKLELARTARRFRAGHGVDRLMSASVITALLIRSVERSERITAAMEARGWDGTPRGLDRVWVER